MTEAHMYQWIKESLNRSLRRFAVQRIESRITSGVPDMWFISDLSTGWIESKVVRSAPDGGVDIPFRPGQFGWIRSMLKVNNKDLSIWLFAYWDGALYAFKNYNIRQGYTKEEFYNMSVYVPMNVAGARVLRGIL